MLVRYMDKRKAENSHYIFTYLPALLMDGINNMIEADDQYLPIGRIGVLINPHISEAGGQLRNRKNK